MIRHVATGALAAGVLALGAACAGAAPRPPPDGLDAAAAREVLTRFVDAVQGERWDAALALASARWRAGYTPGRLALDFRGAGHAARDQAGRVARHLAVGTPIAVGARTARLPLGDGACALLVAEGGGWRVDALEVTDASVEKL